MDVEKLPNELKCRKKRLKYLQNIERFFLHSQGKQWQIQEFSKGVRTRKIKPRRVRMGQKCELLEENCWKKSEKSNQRGMRPHPLHLPGSATKGKSFLYKTFQSRVQIWIGFVGTKETFQSRVQTWKGFVGKNETCEAQYKTFKIWFFSRTFSDFVEKVLLCVKNKNLSRFCRFFYSLFRQFNSFGSFWHL